MEDIQPTIQLQDLLKDPIPIPERHNVEFLVAEAVRLIPVTRLDLVSRVSHGIRTPLAAILGFQEILDGESALNDEERGVFRSIISSESNRLRRFVSSLQTFEELRTSRIQVVRSWGDVCTTLRKAVSSVNSDPLEKGVEILLTAPDLPAEIVADHNRLRLAFEHLVTNAVEATPRGGRVVIACELLDNEVCISVSDSGPGISSDEIDRIFKPFKRIARAEDNGSELGIGLTIVRSIVELNGGMIEVSSNPTKGSRFTVHLPR